MKDVKLTITINRPAHEVFDFVLNPENTPQWIDAVAKEQANETTARLGTIYKSQGKDGNWRELEVTDFDPGAMFVMSDKNSNIHVKYVFKPVDDNRCELEYYVWVDNGDVGEPFTKENLQNIVQKLKKILEIPNSYLFS